MPRMESNDERATITLRLPAETKREYKAIVDSMSDDLREYIDGVVTEPNDDRLPNDEKLAAGLKTLRENADPDTGRINAETAKSLIAERSNVPKVSVRRRVLKPLERRGILSLNWGTIILKTGGDSR